MNTLRQLIGFVLVFSLVACGGDGAPEKNHAGTVVVFPHEATVQVGETFAFAATVDGAASKRITWSVDGGDANGTITADGVYTAPDQPGAYTVTATSAGQKDAASVTVVPASAVSVSITAPATTVRTEGTLTFSATVTGVENTAVTWSLEEGAAAGSIDGDGVYTAPAEPGVFTVVATSVADPMEKATVQVTVFLVDVAVTPATATIDQGATTTFAATVSGTAEGEVTWSVEGEGNGTITADGVYTAPLRAGTYAVVAKSVADPSKGGSAFVTVREVKVAIDPATATVSTAGTTTFTATVTGTVASTEVTWSVLEGAGGGSISESGVYTAPTAGGTYAVVATTVADPAKSAIARVTVVPVDVAVSPTAVTLDQGATTTLVADVTGTTVTDVVWSVDGGDENGTVTADGVYTAPHRAGTFTVLATSVADSSKSGAALISVRDVLVAIDPTTATVSTAGTTAFSATVTGTTGSTAVTWSVLDGAAGGSISDTGVYTAPTTGGTYTVVATSVADPAKSATAVVTVVPVAVSVSPTAVTLDQGESTTLTATVTGTQQTDVTWSVVGGAGNGTVTTAGVYTAPTNAGTYTVQATSVADPSKTAAATITVLPIVVVVSPGAVTVDQGASTTLTAQVTGALDTGLTWSVFALNGSGDIGTITNAGVYTAPHRAGTYTVRATSTADATKSGTATVTVLDVAVQVTPEAITLRQGETTTFTASVTGTVNTAVSWSANSGSIDAAGVYTAPTAPGSYTVVATSAADGSKSAQATVTVPVAARLAYVDPPATGWRFVKNTVESTTSRLVLDLVGPSAGAGYGVDATLSTVPTRARWAKVVDTDTEHVANRAFHLGSGPQLMKGLPQEGSLLLGVFQKGTSSPAVPYAGALVSVALELEADDTLASGATVPLTVLKAHALDATTGLTPITVAVGTLVAE